MKLIVIYGPPAAGKLTVAKELSKLTGFKVLHNHITIDLIDHFIGFDKRHRCCIYLNLVEINIRYQVVVRWVTVFGEYYRGMIADTRYYY